MNYRSFIALLVVIAFPPLSMYAGGSFFFTDLKELLDQQPILARFIADHLDVAEVGDAPRIGTGINKSLSGIRVAPFEIPAKPKGTSGEFTLMLVVDAETTYLDSRKRVVSLERATDLKQKLIGIRLRHLTDQER